MEFNQIIELINAISDSKVTSFTLEEGDKKLTIKAGDKNTTQVVQVPVAVSQPAMVAPATVAPTIAAPQMVAENVVSQATEADAQSEPYNVKTVKSPLVGTFYAAPSPDDAPFISVGDTVKKGQVIGIVEAMKLMNEIESEHDGVVTEIMVNNGDMVEYGQILVKVK